MRVLIVGAGAVGQAYGLALQRGGADVAFFVKEKHAAECRAGFTVYELGAFGRRRRYRIDQPGCYTSAAVVAREFFDQLWLCVSSTALRAPWLADLCGATGDATVVSLTPGLEDREYVAVRCGQERLVSGVITLVAYQTPLPGDARDERGVAVWFPPLSKSPFAGEPARATEIVQALRRGGCPAKLQARAWEGAARASSVMMPMLVALEAEGWSLRGLRKSPRLRVAVAAAREALQIVARHQDRAPGLLRFLAAPLAMKILLRLAPRFVPFDFQTYLEYHFTKVGDQTRLLIKTYVERGEALGASTRALRELQHLLPEPPAPT